jgi:hypothetical protein
MRLKTTWRRHGCFGSVAICDYGLARSVVRHTPKRDVEVAVRIICLPVASTFRSITKTEVTHVKTRHVLVVMSRSNYTRCALMRSSARPSHCAVVVSRRSLSMLTEGFLAYQGIFTQYIAATMDKISTTKTFRSAMLGNLLPLPR